MSSLSPSTTLFLMESSMAAEHQASLGLKEPPHQHQGWSPCPKKSKDYLAKMEDDLRSKEDNLKVGRSSLRKGEDVPRKPLAGMISKKFLETPGQEPDSCLWDSQDGRKEDYPEFSILSPDTLSSMIKASHATDNWAATMIHNGEKQTKQFLKEQHFADDPVDNSTDFC